MRSDCAWQSGKLGVIPGFISRIDAVANCRHGAPSLSSESAVTMDHSEPRARHHARQGAARAGPAGRRRARLLSGRRLSGAVPLGFRTGMGRRHLDRRDQCRDHRRQRSRNARRSPQGILGDGVVPGVVESGDAGRPRALAVQRDQRRADRHLRRARLLHAAYAAGAAVAARQPAIAELLRHRAAEEDAGAAGRLRPHQRPEDPAQRRRGRRDLGQFQIFRQFRVQEARQEDRAGAHHGLRRAAAGLSVRRHRRRALLGRRHRLQHAARLSCWTRKPTATS